MPLTTALIAATALGLVPSGFSLEAILVIDSMPCSRRTSEAGLPGTYGGRDLM